MTDLSIAISPLVVRSYQAPGVDRSDLRLSRPRMCRSLVDRRPSNLVAQEPSRIIGNAIFHRPLRFKTELSDTRRVEISILVCRSLGTSRQLRYRVWIKSVHGRRDCVEPRNFSTANVVYLVGGRHGVVEDRHPTSLIFDVVEIASLVTERKLSVIRCKIHRLTANTGMNHSRHNVDQLVVERPVDCAYPRDPNVH